jgi:hypothetical protein
MISEVVKDKVWLSAAGAMVRPDGMDASVEEIVIRIFPVLVGRRAPRGRLGDQNSV